ncbi:acyltransferase domain-containing protein, partial [Streptomyces sp. ME19-01-6]|uniref:acyltransferase domain-containing protein n=1 Tax=Streptomyces sp. ME19-01-6 TaxID=3028686 RepID=UPI0029B51B68
MALRSRLIAGELAGLGGMVSLGVSADEVRGWLERWPGRLALAAVNGPRSVVVSGEPQALEELLAGCEADGVRARRVAVDYASHSDQVGRIEEELGAVLAGVAPMPGRLPVYSTVTGALCAGEEMDAGYWYRNLRGTVRFQSAIDALLEQRFGVFVEVSAHPVLVPSLVESIDEAGMDAVALGTLRRGEGGQERMVASAAEAWVHGVEVDWASLLPV